MTELGRSGQMEWLEVTCAVAPKRLIAMTPTEQLDNSAPKLVEQLIRQAEHSGASDVHLQMIGKAAEVAFRLDGVMIPTSTLAEDVAERVFGRIKFLARLKTYQDSLPQDGRIDKAAVGAQNDIRVATYPTVTGEKIVVRLFASSVTKSLRELDYPAEVCNELESFLRRNSGLLLLTGPAGSGKTTTIYSCLRFLAELGGRHVVTIEDPVEQIIPGIMQTEINEARALTFAKAARHLLRQDPQTLVIGEIRDEETANIAVHAALTGHMVIATLHAGSCQGVFERLLLMCEDSYAVVSAMQLVLNQRLIRRRCQHCSGVPCSVCLSTGYHGRIPLVEWFRVETTMRAKIRNHGPGVIEPQGSLAQAARELLDRQLSDESEVKRVLG